MFGSMSIYKNSFRTLSGLSYICICIAGLQFMRKIIICNLLQTFIETIKLVFITEQYFKKSDQVYF